MSRDTNPRNPFSGDCDVESGTAQEFQRRIEQADRKARAIEGGKTEGYANGLNGVSQAGQCCQARPNPRQLIEDRIQYHNRMANGLHALLRAMPQEMSYPADDALASLIIESRPKW